MHAIVAHNQPLGDQMHAIDTRVSLRYVMRWVELADELKTTVPGGMTMAQWALRWILDHPEVSVVIPGASKPRHVAGNAAASQLPPLDPALHAELREFYDSRIAAHIRGAY